MYTTNDDIHRNLKIQTVSEVIQKQATQHEKRLLNHPNFKAVQLLDNSEETRRLKRTKPSDLVA
jgi:hypothetical protein